METQDYASSGGAGDPRPSGGSVAPSLQFSRLNVNAAEFVPSFLPRPSADSVPDSGATTTSEVTEGSPASSGKCEGTYSQGC